VVTIDASVLIAASLDDEEGGEEARALLRAIGAAGLTVEEPSLALVELAAGVARRTGRRDLVARALRLLAAMPGITFHPLDVPMAGMTATVAAELALRAGDAVYAAVARETGSTLVTSDRELLERAGPIVATRTPGDWLSDPDH
jgi:predicted nucleic acid-binding protein